MMEKANDVTVDDFSLGTVFCALQLDNVLLSGLDPQLVKLCDFGYSKDGDLESACKTTCGTPEYMAPEVRVWDRVWGRGLGLSQADNPHDLL